MPPPLPLQIENWQLAEKNAAAWMRWWGHPDARVTKGGSDGGIDVEATGAVAQVKFQAVQVGRQELQRLFGARGRDLNRKLFFFTGAGYSAPAVAYADEEDIALFQYSLSGGMRPMSVSARLVLRAVETRESHAQEEAPSARRAEAIRATREAAREAAWREEARQASLRVAAKRAAAEVEARRVAVPKPAVEPAEREGGGLQSARQDGVRPQAQVREAVWPGKPSRSTAPAKKTQNGWNPAPRGKATAQPEKPRPVAREPQRRLAGYWFGLLVLTLLLGLPSAIDAVRGNATSAGRLILVGVGVGALFLFLVWISAVKHNRRIRRSG